MAGVGRLRSSLTHLRVRSLRCSAPPCQDRPCRRNVVAPTERPLRAADRLPPERSPSGLWRRTGNAVRGNPSRVRIPPSPPSSASARLGQCRTAPRPDADRRPCYPSASRARRGTSGALYLQSAPAGLNSLPRSPFSKAARRATLRTGSRAAANREPCQVRKEAALSDHRRVPRNGLVRAARHGGHGDVLVDGGCTALRLRPPATDRSEAVTPSRPAPGALPPLARPDLRRDRRPGSGRRDAPQRRPDGPGRARRPVRRAARHGQDVAGPDPRQGGQLHRPPGRRRRATRCPSCVSIREGTTLDLIEIDAASNRGIDDVRDLRERLAYPPGQLRRKVYILDEAHQITQDAWNALLKSLEEPPDFVIFMFASTEPSGFPPAILSRLQRFDVRRLTVAEIEGKLARILAADGRTAEPGRAST